MSINKFSGKDLLEVAGEAASHYAAKLEALRARRLAWATHASVLEARHAHRRGGDAATLTLSP